MYAGDTADVERLEIREADFTKYFVTLVRGSADNETVMIHKRDLDLAVHVFSPEASEVTVRFRCRLALGRDMNCDLADCRQCAFARRSPADLTIVGATSSRTLRANAAARALF